MTGWIKLFRKFKEWEWYQDVNIKCVFIHLILSANTEEKKWQGEVIKPGQLITSYDNISKGSGVSVQSVRTAIKKLEKTNELTIKTTNKYSLITLLKWDNYQANKQLTNNQQTTNNQLTTTKEYKNNKKNIIGDDSDSILIKDFNLENCKLKDERRLPFEWSLKTYQVMKEIYPENKSLDFIPLREFVTPLRKIFNIYPVETYRIVFNYATKHDFWKSKITDLNSLQRNFEKIKSQYNEDARKGVV